MSFYESQEFWLSISVLIIGAVAIFFAYLLGKFLSEKDLAHWFNKYIHIFYQRELTPNNRKLAQQEFSEMYRDYLLERNDFWEKYGQITVSIIIIVFLVVLLLTKTISPEAGLPILSAVGGFAIAKTANSSNRQNRPDPSDPES